MRMELIPMEQLAKLLEVQLENGTAPLRVTGSSMYPTLRNGRDTVYLEKLDRPADRSDLILYRRDSGSYVLHRVVRLHRDALICCGDNQFRTEQIGKDQVLAVVTAFTRKGKHYTIQDRGYRLYIALWAGLYPLRWLYLGCRRALGRIRAAIRHRKSKQSA